MFFAEREAGHGADVVFFGQSGTEILLLNHFFFYQIGSLLLASALPEAAGRRAFSLEVLLFCFVSHKAARQGACLYLFLGGEAFTRGLEKQQVRTEAGWQSSN